MFFIQNGLDPGAVINAVTFFDSRHISGIIVVFLLIFTLSFLTIYGLISAGHLQTFEIYVGLTLIPPVLVTSLCEPNIIWFLLSLIPFFLFLLKQSLKK